MYANELPTKKVFGKVTLEMLEEKVKSFPYYNPDNQRKLKFGQYIEVIESERNELLRMFKLFKSQDCPIACRNNGQCPTQETGDRR